MSILTGQHRLVSLLIELLDLPKHCVWFDLRIHASEVATVRCEYYPQPYEIYQGDDGEKRLRTRIAEWEITKVERRTPKIALRDGLCGEAFTASTNAWLADLFGYAGNCGAHP